VVVATVAAAVTFVTVVGSGADRPTTTAGASRIPTQSRERWSVTLDVAGVRTVGGSSEAIVFVADGESPALVALDTATGAQRWSVPQPSGLVDAVDVFDDVVVLTVVEPAGRVLRGLDLGSGTERWSLSAEGEDRPSVDEGQVVVVRQADGSSSARSVRWIDPATGDVESEIDGGAITLSRSGVVRRDGDRIEVFERDPVRSRAVVDLAALGLSGQREARVAATEAGVVVATPTVVMLVDDGLVVSTIRVSARQVGQHRLGLQPLDPAGMLVALEHDDGLIVYSTDGGVLRQLWSASAWLLDWHVDAGRRLLAVATVTGSVVSMPPQIVDAATGTTLWDGPAAVQQSSPLRTFGDDGFIVVAAPRARSGSAAIVGYDLDRMELWRRPIEPGSDFALVDDGLVTIRPYLKAGATRLTLYS
jgi:hypothetical protein